MTISDLRSEEWNASYARRDNFLFYPHEEVIRFVAKYVCKRVGYDEYVWHLPEGPRRGLGVGCGIGRHVFYLDDCGLDAYGIDLSDEAIRAAQSLARKLGREHLVNHFVVRSATEMPYSDNYFQVAISHGVLDSMPFAVARDVVRETHRVLDQGGVFYLDLISGADNNHGREFSGEENVVTQHEENTIQSYFNYSRILELLEGFFTIKEGVLVTRAALLSPGSKSRYHLFLQRN